MRASDNEFWTFMITMIVGGLVYSLASFSYIHSQFTTTSEMEAQDKRLDRIEYRIDDRLKTIESKLDKIIGRSDVK